MRTSPARGTFTMGMYEKKLIEYPTDTDAMNMVDFYKNDLQRRQELEETVNWQTDNMEYDLRSSTVIAEKCTDPVYAQHLYAALCNNEFTKNDIWPILSDKRWSSSWRHSGGIVSNIREEGDYIDWYCSGIQRSTELCDDYEQGVELTAEEHETLRQQLAYVNEGVVTDEIRKDMLDLGWIVAE